MTKTDLLTQLLLLLPPSAPTSQVLRRVRVSVTSRQECNTNYATLGDVFRQLFPRGIDESLICATAGPGQAVCRGDSGGPLIYEDPPPEGRHEAVGVVSAGHGCGDVSFPSLYTRIDVFLDWIDGVVYGACSVASLRAVAK
ncbi:clotting factor G beta subunit-like [Oratosquilla oratoria]|uniref:clotting factor G beta subunit-like n=1 Tax=Oratosquilla oratoria TaxID=337810 RepID=UPI003F773093